MLDKNTHILVGKDADEYVKICNGEIQNREKQIEFDGYISRHMTIKRDDKTNDVYIESDLDEPTLS